MPVATQWLGRCEKNRARIGADIVVFVRGHQSVFVDVPWSRPIFQGLLAVRSNTLTKNTLR
jgi:hypothetical protein